MWGLQCSEHNVPPHVEAPGSRTRLESGCCLALAEEIGLIFHGRTPTYSVIVVVTS